MEPKQLKQTIDLTEKVVIVTGGAMGIGFGIAYRLAEAGASVVIADMNKKVADESVIKLLAKGWKASAVAVDVSNAEQVKSLIDAAVNTFGSVDILVNNAGIYPFKPFLEMQEADFAKVIDINLKGYFFAAQAAAKIMQKNQPNEKGLKGSIVNIASVAAIIGFAGLSHYCASKGGVVAMSKAMALELAPLGIRINNIAPGAIDTPGASNAQMTDEQRAAMVASEGS